MLTQEYISRIVVAESNDITALQTAYYADGLLFYCVTIPKYCTTNVSFIVIGS